MKKGSQPQYTVGGRIYSLRTRYAAMSLAQSLAEASHEIYTAAACENWARLVRAVMDATLAMRELSKVGQDELSGTRILQRVAEEQTGGSQESWENIQSQWGSQEPNAKRSGKKAPVQTASAYHSRVSSV